MGGDPAGLPGVRHRSEQRRRKTHPPIHGKELELKSVEIFSDGCCRGNPGPGGYGCILRYNGLEKELKGAVKHTTNNEMELTAVLAGIRALKTPCRVKVTTDSKYVVDGITDWIHKWVAKGWKTVSNKPVKNLALWQELYELSKKHEIRWEWTKGHAGHPENERCDRLANRAVDALFAKRG